MFGLRVSSGTLGKNTGTTYHWSASSSVWDWNRGADRLVVADTTLVKKKERKENLG